MNAFPAQPPIGPFWTSYLDYAKIYQEVLRPQNANRRRVAMILNAPEMKGQTGRSCLETLAAHGVVPMSMLEDRRREFDESIPNVGGFRSQQVRDLGTDRRVTGAYPISRKHAFTWASDVTNITGVEELAREAARRLQRFRRGHDIETERVVWRFYPRHARQDLSEGRVSAVARYLNHRVPCATDTLRRARSHILNTIRWAYQNGAFMAMPLLMRLAWYDYVAMVQWDTVGCYRAQEGIDVVYLTRAEAEYYDPIEELPNPFRPIVDIWNRGYAFGGNTDDAIVVYALSLQ